MKHLVHFPINELNGFVLIFCTNYQEPSVGDLGGFELFGFCSSENVFAEHYLLSACCDFLGEYLFVKSHDWECRRVADVLVLLLDLFKQDCGFDSFRNEFRTFKSFLCRQSAKKIRHYLRVRSSCADGDYS